MNYTDITNKCIYFEAKQGAKLNDVLVEAHQFIRDNNISECDVEFNGYLFNLEPGNDLAAKMAEYENAQKIKANG